MPQLFLGLYFNQTVAEPVLLRIAVFLRNVLRFVVKTLGGFSALSGCAPESLGFLLSQQEVENEIRSRSISLHSLSTNQEVKGLAGEIMAFCSS